MDGERGIFHWSMDKQWPASRLQWGSCSDAKAVPPAKRGARSLYVLSIILVGGFRCRTFCETDGTDVHTYSGSQVIPKIIWYMVAGGVFEIT